MSYTEELEAAIKAHSRGSLDRDIVIFMSPGFCHFVSKELWEENRMRFQLFHTPPNRRYFLFGGIEIEAVIDRTEPRFRFERREASR